MWYDCDDDGNGDDELFCGTVDHSNKNKQIITTTESFIIKLNDFY